MQKNPRIVCEDLKKPFRCSSLVTLVCVETNDWPGASLLEDLCSRIGECVLAETGFIASERGCEVSLLFTNDAEMKYLNHKWRKKAKSTNVLSFPLQTVFPDNILPCFLGDIVLAQETVEGEALEAGIPFLSHVSQLVVHGFLHLLGFDHQTDEEADRMEEQERRVLQRLAIREP